jgi:mannose-6-phosphate isomerase-like protein (cupin superfamily)
MHSLREPLNSDHLGVSVGDCEPGWNSRRDDHGQDVHEEIYVLMEGRATVVVEEEPVPMEPGDAIRLSPDATRQIRNADTRSTFVLVGVEDCPRPGDADPEWPVDGFQG